jgi:hypothetical protein
MDTQHQQQQQQSLSGAGAQHPFQNLPNPGQGSQWGGESQQLSSFQQQYQQAVPGAQMQQQPPQQNPGLQASNQVAFMPQQSAGPMQPYPQQPQLAFHVSMPQNQPQGMGMPFAHSYPQFYQHPSMGSFPMPQLPQGMMSGMITAPHQIWVPQSVVPAQPADMEVDEDAKRPKGDKSSFSSSAKKKSKGKAKASDEFVRQQQEEEMEGDSSRLSRRIEDAGVDPEIVELASSAINDEAVHSLIEQLLACVDMLRSEKRQVEQDLIREEDERMRLQDEVLWFWKEEKRREKAHQREDEERYRKKRKEWEFEQLPSGRDDRVSRESSSRASDRSHEPFERQ